jgi:hypothetical protein
VLSCHQRQRRFPRLDLGIRRPHGYRKRRRFRSDGGASERHVDQSTLDISGGVQSSAAFNSQTKYVRITCEVQCAVKVGGTATTSSLPIGAMSPEYFGVQPGATLSVIANP